MPSNVQSSPTERHTSSYVALISDRAYCVEVWVGSDFPEKGQNRKGGKWVTHPATPEFSSIEEAEKWAEQVCGNTRVVDVNRGARFYTPRTLKEMAR